MKKIILKGTLPSLKFQNVFWTKNDSGASLRTQILSVGCIFDALQNDQKNFPKFENFQ